MAFTFKSLFLNKWRMHAMVERVTLLKNVIVGIDFDV